VTDVQETGSADQPLLDGVAPATLRCPICLRWLADGEICCASVPTHSLAPFWEDHVIGRLLLLDDESPDDLLARTCQGPPRIFAPGEAHSWIGCRLHEGRAIWLWSTRVDELAAPAPVDGDEQAAERFGLRLRTMTATDGLLVQVPDGSPELVGRYLLENQEVDAPPAQTDLLSDLMAVVEECRPRLGAVALVGRDIPEVTVQAFGFLAEQVRSFASSAEGLGWLLETGGRRGHRRSLPAAGGGLIEVLDVGGTTCRELLAALHEESIAGTLARARSFWRRWLSRVSLRRLAVDGVPLAPAALEWVEVQRLRGVPPSLHEVIPPWQGLVRRRWRRSRPVEVHLGPFGAGDGAVPPSAIVLGVGDTHLVGERDLSWLVEYFVQRGLAPAVLLRSRTADPGLVTMARELAPSAVELVYDPKGDPLQLIEQVIRHGLRLTEGTST
jgi:hypothetical protein